MASIEGYVLEGVEQSGGVPAITWRVTTAHKHLYEYMAIYVTTTQLWYIAGDAKFYGSAVKTRDEMLRYLQQPEVERVNQNTQAWKQISRD